MKPLAFRSSSETVTICFATNPLNPKTTKTRSYRPCLLQTHVVSLTTTASAAPAIEEKPKRKFKWVEIKTDNMTESQKQKISKLPYNMSNRCKALMRQIICSRNCPEMEDTGLLSDLLGCWVRVMKPKRADWLSILKQLNQMEHPLFISVAEFSLNEESFEANVRDYTKVIHFYGRQNRVRDAEGTLLAMKRRGFVCDQVTLTTMIHIYSKTGNLKLAEEAFEELKLLGEPLDKRSYGAMIMAYIRAGLPEKGEVFLREMDELEIRAGTEIYKALLRSYSMVGNAEGAQRVFDAIQFAGIPPDVKVCALLINAYRMAGQSENALIALENMLRAGIEPNDRCVALVLDCYEQVNELIEALNFLIDLDRRGIVLGKEASELLARWFRKLGVVQEVEMVLREFIASEATPG